MCHSVAGCEIPPSLAIVWSPLQFCHSQAPANRRSAPRLSPNLLRAPEQIKQRNSSSGIFRLLAGFAKKQRAPAWEGHQQALVSLPNSNRESISWCAKCNICSSDKCLWFVGTSTGQAWTPFIRTEFRYSYLHLHVLVVRICPVSLPGTSKRWVCKRRGGDRGESQRRNPHGRCSEVL